MYLVPVPLALVDEPVVNLSLRKPCLFTETLLLIILKREAGTRVRYTEKTKQLPENSLMDKAN